MNLIDPALLQGEEPIVLHLLDDLGELRVRILPGYRFVLIREQVFGVGGAESGQPLRHDADRSRGVLG